MKIYKFLITDYKRASLYGDCLLEEDGYYFPFIGKVLRVKILGLFWVTYNKYKIKK